MIISHDDVHVSIPFDIGDIIWLPSWWKGTKLVELNTPVQRSIRYFTITSDGLNIHLKDGCINYLKGKRLIFTSKEEALSYIRKRDSNKDE